MRKKKKKKENFLAEFRLHVQLTNKQIVTVTSSSVRIQIVSAVTLTPCRYCIVVAHLSATQKLAH